jgi:predicted ATPase
MIRRLTLRGYKSFENATLEAGPLTVIFGPNDAGKSNFFDAITLLSVLAEADSLKKAFDTGTHRGQLVEAFRSPLGFGSTGLDKLRDQEHLEMELEADLELQPELVERINRVLTTREELAQTRVPYTRVAERSLRYRIKLRHDVRSGETFVADENLTPLTRQRKPRLSRGPFLSRERNRFVVRIERQAHPRYFDPGRNRSLLSEISDPVYHPHIVAAKEEIKSWRSYYVEPSLVRRDSGVFGADDPGRHGEDLAAFFWKLKLEHPEHLRNVALNLRSLVPSLAGLDVNPVLGRLDAVVRERNGGEFPFRLASEGTLRLLCLLAIAIAPHPPALVAYEEPENGVQPGRLDILTHILQSLAERGTQVLLTTHSATFLNRVRGATLVACRRNSRGDSEFFPYQSQDAPFSAVDLEDSALVAEPEWDLYGGGT